MAVHNGSFCVHISCESLAFKGVSFEWVWLDGDWESLAHEHEARKEKSTCFGVERSAD